MNKIINRKCPVCLKIFQISSMKRHKRSRARGYRGKNNVTCSKLCSKVNLRVVECYNRRIQKNKLLLEKWLKKLKNENL